MHKYPCLVKSTDELNQIILQNYLLDGIVSTDKTLDKIIMTQREKIIKKHEETHSIWQSQSNGRWCTKIGAEKRLIVKKERADLENAIVEFYLLDLKQTATVNDVFWNWRDWEICHNNHSPKTINEYECEYRRFLEKIDFASYPIHDVTERDITHLLTSIVYDGEKVPLKRYKAVKTVIRTIFNHAKIQMGLDCIPVKNIMDDLTFPSTAFKQTDTDTNKQVFKHSEIKMMKEYLKDTDNLLELGILLTIETGVRVGELCTLKRDCVTKDYLLIRTSEHKAKLGGKYSYYIDTPKKDKARDVILNSDAKQILERILSLHNSEWLFPNKEDTSTWSHAHQFDRAIRRVCRNLGIQVRSMHKLRKTYSSCLLAQKNLGVTDKLVQAQLGHSDISTTHRAYYYDVFDEEEKQNILSGVRIG